MFKFLIQNYCFFKITYLYCAQHKYKALIVNIFRIALRHKYYSI